ncbi:MAG TPA: translation initiation factor IF-2 N-terminal domain-containing protein, partial [Candidatus Binatia bacterium]|nr:translation initiation factor IF-2 N-terminal domain-containing protein [Candidatus Binatia bacterium]
MGKTRVHLLAKELGIETKDLITQLDKLGIRGRKAQSALEDDEVTRIRAALAGQDKPQVHVGEEKVVADRVVTAEDENLGEIQARETVVERRVRANVIRRRTSRVEVVSQAGEKPDAEVVETGPEKTPASAIEETAPIAPAEEFPEGPGAEIEIPDQLTGEMEAVFQEEPPSAEEMITEAAPSAQPVPEESAKPATEEKPTPVQEAPRGARILGRIDLRRTTRVEPAPTPVARRPVPGAPAAPSVVPTEALRPARDGEAAKPQGAEGEKPAKPGRHKKRVVKKQDVLEFREKELRSGR